MRILWVKIGGLWPLDSGGRLRSFHLISQLSRRHRVSVVTTHAANEDPAALVAHLPDCAQVLSVPHDPPKWRSAGFPLALLRSWFTSLPVDLWKSQVPALRRTVASILATGEVDVCVADFIFAVPNLPEPLAVPTVFFAHNVEHMIWKRLCSVQGNPLTKLLLALEWRKMRRCEARACLAASNTLCVSEPDRELLATISPGARIHAVPTGVDVEYFSPEGIPERPTELVFTGSMDWHPNEDAILHFMEAILPGIRKEAPEVSVTVVGRNPGEKVRRIARRCGVEVTGRVADVRPYISRATVYFVPLRIGGGTRLKIFEALAMGKAVVSTGIGAEGLPLVDGQHFLRADDPATFVRRILELLRNPWHRVRLGAAGRRLVEEKYSWPRVTDEFARCLTTTN